VADDPQTDGSGSGGGPRQGLVNRVLADRYDVLEVIGEGPLLAAYRARDRALNRIVAVKAILPKYADRADVRERLRAGLGQVIALAHPNIVRAYDVGTDASAGDLLFLAEEYVRGIDLKERIRRAAPFQLAAAADTTVAVAEALEYAHARGVVHGDVRPQNVLIGPEGQVKLTGFGAADAQALVIGDDPPALKRIVPYIAPDAARAASPTASGDLYALGVLLYELLTGEIPFKGDNALQIALRHAQDPVPSPRAVNTGVPRALDGVVQKALGKRPDERYASAGDLLADLRAVRDALKYGRSLAWSPMDRGAVAAPTNPAPALEDATIAGPVLGAAAAASVPPPVAPAAAPTPSAEETLVMPAMAAAATPVNRRVATIPAAAAPASPYVNSATGAVASTPAAAVAVEPVMEEEPVVQNSRGGGGGNRWLLSVNLFLFLLALGGIGGLVWLTFYSLSPASEVVVPNLVGRSITQAKQLAAEQNFQVSVVDEQFRDGEKAEPSGTIYQMQPAPGRHIRSGKNVSVWVSKGPRMSDIPDVRSMSFEKARRVIEKNSLRVGDYTFEFDSLEPKGNVIRQAPAAGESRPRGTRVDLVLSKGEEPPPTPVPDLPPPPETTFTPAPTDVPTPDEGSGAPSAPDGNGTPPEARVRTFDVRYPVPNDGAAHRIRIDVTDRDGTRTVYDETRNSGEAIKQRVEAVGKQIRIRLFDNDQLQSELVPPFPQR
jgi:serine/threonine-protein kinase